MIRIETGQPPDELLVADITEQFCVTDVVKPLNVG